MNDPKSELAGKLLPLFSWKNLTDNMGFILKLSNKDLYLPKGKMPMPDVINVTHTDTPVENYHLTL